RLRPKGCRVRWIIGRGLGDWDVTHSLAEKYALHPLAIEDVLGGTQRPRVDDYPASGEDPGRLFVVAKTVGASGERLVTKQVSFFLGRTTLLTFQEGQ